MKKKRVLTKEQKDKQKQYNKTYYEENKSKFQQYFSDKYYQDRKANIERSKQYYRDHKDEINQRRRDNDKTKKLSMSEEDKIEIKREKLIRKLTSMLFKIESLQEEIAKL